MTTTHILAAVRTEHASRFYKGLSSYAEFKVHLVTETQNVLDKLADGAVHVDVIILDNGLGAVPTLVKDIRQSYPRLFIVLVDEEADFGTPGQADDISTEPFNDNDLVRRITRLMSDRQLQTLRADSLPAVRHFAKELRNAPGESGKQQATVNACKQLGYDYVAFYKMDTSDTLSMTLRAQAGPPAIQAVAPKAATLTDLMTWVLEHNQSRIAGPQDSPNHPLVAKGRLACVACVPVLFSGNRYGVLLAFRDVPNSISQENVLLLELMAAQLGAAISKELIG